MICFVACSTSAQNHIEQILGLMSCNIAVIWFMLHCVLVLTFLLCYY